MTRLKWIIFSLALLVPFTVYFFYPQTNQAPSTSRIQAATPQEIKKHIQSLNARLTLVNFWASWCEPCKVEFPYILEVERQFQDRGVKVVFVSVDDPVDLTIADNFLAAQNVRGPTFYKGFQPLDCVNQIFPNWSGAVPASLLLSPDLQIRDAWEGDTTMEELTQRLERQLSGT